MFCSVSSTSMYLHEPMRQPFKVGDSNPITLDVDDDDTEEDKGLIDSDFDFDLEPEEESDELEK